MKAPAELWRVAVLLGDLRDDVVFVGGIVRELLVTDPAAGPARATADVDLIVDVKSLGEHVAFSERLRDRGFREANEEGAPICRWIAGDLRIDVMPIDPAILGFGNVWYASGVDHSVRVEGVDASIRIVDAPHFCAMKIEAFNGRGDGDWYHHDIEDFLAVVDGRPELIDDLRAAPNDVREFVADALRRWLQEPGFIECLAGHLPPDAASQERQPLLLRRLRAIAGLGT